MWRTSIGHQHGTGQESRTSFEYKHCIELGSIWICTSITNDFAMVLDASHINFQSMPGTKNPNIGTYLAWLLNPRSKKHENISIGHLMDRVALNSNSDRSGILRSNWNAIVRADNKDQSEFPRNLARILSWKEFGKNSLLKSPKIALDFSSFIRFCHLEPN